MASVTRWRFYLKEYSGNGRKTREFKGFADAEADE
jgi:hypothetical protein